MDMQTWVVEVFGAFPENDVIDPNFPDGKSFDELTDEQKREVLDGMSDTEQEWMFDSEITSKISPAEALDYYMVEYAGFKPSQWAEYRGRGTESIRKNRRQAETKLKALLTNEGVNYMPDVEVGTEQ